MLVQVAWAILSATWNAFGVAMIAQGGRSPGPTASIVARYQQSGWAGNPLLTPAFAGCSCRLSQVLARRIEGQLESGQP